MMCVIAYDVRLCIIYKVQLRLLCCKFDLFFLLFLFSLVTGFSFLVFFFIYKRVWWEIKSLVRLHHACICSEYTRKFIVLLWSMPLQIFTSNDRFRNLESIIIWFHIFVPLFFAIFLSFILSYLYTIVVEHYNSNTVSRTIENKTRTATYLLKFIFSILVSDTNFIQSFIILNSYTNTIYLTFFFHVFS